MVYCSYCGTQNREGSLKCVKCGKPLALFSDEDDVPQRSLRDSPKNSPRNISRNSSGNISMNTPIKERYRANENIGDNSYPQRNSHSQRNSYSQENSYNAHSPNLNRRSSKSMEDMQNQYNPYDSSFEPKYKPTAKKPNKHTIEWDVVIATALLVIILSAILGRFLPTFAFFISLLTGLIYILIATKSKSGLIKSILLAIVMISAVSAYFSI